MDKVSRPQRGGRAGPSVPGPPSSGGWGGRSLLPACGALCPNSAARPGAAATTSPRRGPSSCWASRGRRACAWGPSSSSWSCTCSRWPGTWPPSPWSGRTGACRRRCTSSSATCPSWRCGSPRPACPRRGRRSPRAAEPVLGRLRGAEVLGLRTEYFPPAATACERSLAVCRPLRYGLIATTGLSAQFFLINILQCGWYVTVDEPKFIHYYELTTVIYIRVRSEKYTFCGSRQLHMQCTHHYRIIQKFHGPENPLFHVFIPPRLLPEPLTTSDLFTFSIVL